VDIVHEFAPQIVTFALSVLIALVTAITKYVAGIAASVHRIEVLFENVNVRVAVLESTNSQKRSPR
jgi:hypothetical protein